MGSCISACNEDNENTPEPIEMKEMIWIKMFRQYGYTSLSNTTGNRFQRRHELIREYFYAGYSYAEILWILLHQHEISVCLRTLSRILRSLGLRRHFSRQDCHRVVSALEFELQESGSSLGYRSMARRLLTRHGLYVPRQLVSELQHHLDGNGVERRTRHRFNRRVYVNNGPNYLIHLDGYDKLKPYGFAVHGAICGYSRRVLWLNASNSNNDPKVIATYFLNYIDEIKAVPRCVRMDAGTENVLVADIQKAFRWDHTDDMSGNKSVIIGSSHSNQRIERWWLSNRQGGCQFWIDTFKDLENCGLYSSSNLMQRECARFCFMELLQSELDQIRMEWNQHCVRQSRVSESPGGKPDMMFYLPNIYGTVDYKIAVLHSDIDGAKEMCSVRVQRGASEEFAAVFSDIMTYKGYVPPSTFHEALQLYGNLITFAQT